jgi:ATP-dependent helicase HrpB
VQAGHADGAGEALHGLVAAPLPIDPLLPEVAAELARAPSLVLEAPPGAGKTTRVPPALDAAGVCAGKQIWVCEPRRLAARLAARRVAAERAETVGQTVGYQVRFDSQVSAATRIVFATPGVLVRRLIAEPTLVGVGAIVLDEFHERQLEVDLVLALARRLQRGARPDLKLLVMSATLDAAPIADFLEARRLHAEGRQFDVAIEHLERPPGELASEVARAAARLCREGPSGDILVFLPGAKEIDRAARACEPVAREHGRMLARLHGALPPEEQDLAIAKAARPKIILSTNVAETSITIEGVVAVVDSGLARVAGQAAWSGLPLLRVAKVSRAQAAQRAGRAGRTGPGRCIRLYPKHDHDSRPAQETPEIARADLTDAVLVLMGAGIADPRSLEWLTPPPATAVENALALLTRLHAVDDAHRLTELGRELARFPLHPRLARLVVEADRRGVAEAGCTLAALLSERLPERAGKEVAGRSDALAWLEGADRGPITRATRQLTRLCQARTAAPKDEEAALLLALLCAFPDRVARRRARGRRELVLCSGEGALLAPWSVVHQDDLLVAIDAEERREPGRAGAQITVRAASAIEPEWLVALLPERLREQAEVVWDAAGERVARVHRLYYDALVLEERQLPAAGDPEAARLLAERALAVGAQRFCAEGALSRLRARIEVVARLRPGGIAPPDDAAIAEALRALCEGRASFAELRTADLCQALRARLGAPAALLDRLAPERVVVAGGRPLAVGYVRGQPPSLAIRLQDLFGAREGPKIGDGALPLVLHLLAPNQRPVQVTTDLAGFWQRHYPAIRQQLMRRYPKHAWPEDPLAARPSRPRRS